MKTILALLLQVVMVLIGIGALAFLLWEPHFEGRNARATTFEIYFNDPFLAYVYLGSTPFFVGLYRAFELLRHFRHHGAFSQATVDALRAMQRCAIAIVGFVAVGVVFLLVTVAASVVAIAATILRRHLRNSLRLSEDSLGG